MKKLNKRIVDINHQTNIIIELHAELTYKDLMLSEYIKTISTLNNNINNNYYTIIEQQKEIERLNMLIYCYSFSNINHHTK